MKEKENKWTKLKRTENNVNTVNFLKGFNYINVYFYNAPLNQHKIR